MWFYVFHSYEMKKTTKISFVIKCNIAKILIESLHACKCHNKLMPKHINYFNFTLSS